MNGYMLYVTDEDREALAWVRDHGGLDHVRVEWNERVPRDRYVRRRQSLLDHIAECETALGRRNRRIEELGHRVSDLTNENAELRRRAMPDGCEWPRYEDGKFVQIGDPVSGDFLNRSFNVFSIEFRENETYLHEGFKTDYIAMVHHGKRVKRPAPSVLAADGEPLEVGQTVWDIESGEELKVEKLCDVGLVQLLTRDGVSRYVYQDQITHQRPVLDADGVPIKKGDTVWSVNDGTEYEVVGIRDTEDVDGDLCKIIECSNDELHIYYVCIPPDKLTHTKPEIDSWERVEEDALLPAGKYRERNGMEKRDGMTLPQQIREDLVRRCKALAEKENRNE